MTTRVLALLLIVWASSLAWASCLPPGISVSATTDFGGAVIIGAATINSVRTESRPSLTPSAAITINGSGFMDACNDVIINGFVTPTFPGKGIKLLFIQGDKTVELGRIDANS